MLNNARQDANNNSTTDMLGDSLVVADYRVPLDISGALPSATASNAGTAAVDAAFRGKKKHRKAKKGKKPCDMAAEES